jgi:hypothetical protein
MAQQHPSAVHLDDKTNGRMRELQHAAKSALHEMAELTMTALGEHDEARAIKSSGLDETHIVFNNQKTIFIHGGKCAGVYEDPPGVCRPCVDGG